MEVMSRSRQSEFFAHLDSQVRGIEVASPGLGLDLDDRWEDRERRVSRAGVGELLGPPIVPVLMRLSSL